jgi:hypothetical protein
MQDYKDIYSKTLKSNVANLAGESDYQDATAQSMPCRRDKVTKAQRHTVEKDNKE